MSGAGFRGQGPVPRGRNIRGMGLGPGMEGVSGVRNPHPNFNQPRRESHGPPQEFWPEHPGSAPWQQNDFHHPHPQYPYDPYRFQRGRPQYCPSISPRGRSKRIRGDGRPRGIYQPGGYQMPITRPHEAPPQPEVAKFAPLGSEEERQQKIAETADKLKQKLSSLTVEEPVNFWDDNLVGVAFENDDQEQHLVSNRGIPELRHDPPELNLTVSDFKDIGRVDPDGFGNSTETQDVVEKEMEKEDCSMDSEIYLIDNDEEPGNGTEITLRPKETEPDSFEKKIPAPEPTAVIENESSRPEEKETSTNHNPELSESLEKLRKVIKNDRELEKNRPVFKPSLDFRPEINHPYARFQDHANNSGDSREPRRDRERDQPREQFREQSRHREQFWPDYQRDMQNPQGNFGPDFNRYDSGPRNFTPQSEFCQGPPRMNMRRPMIDHCNVGYDNRGPPQRFNNFRPDQSRNNSWYNHNDNAVMQPPPAFDPRGRPPARFMNPEPEPMYGPTNDYAPVLPMSYGQQIPHIHMGPRPYIPIVNGNFNHIIQPPNTAPCIIPEFLPRITENIDSQTALQPPPPPPPLEEISLPTARDTEKPNPTPNMNEELEDMQEALEFAKKLMNMDEEEELAQSLNMPTFPDLPPIPSTEPSHLVDPVEEVKVTEPSKEDEAVDKMTEIEIVEKEPEPESQILEDQTRTKVVFNVNSTSKIISHTKQSEETSARLKKIREKLANPTITLPKDVNKGLMSPVEEKKERKKKPDEHSASVSVPQENPPSDVSVSKSPASGSKTSKSMLASTVDANWKDKVINQFLKMSKNDICNMVNSSGLRKFDIAMKHLVKERKNALSQERRTSADDAVKGNCDMSREEFMSQLSAMLDPSATVDVKNLPAKFIQHLSVVLKLDVESHLNEAEHVNQFDNGGHHFVVDNAQQDFAQFIPEAEEIPDSGHQIMTPNDFSNVFTTQESPIEPVPNMEVLDDIFSAGITRAKLGLVPKFPETSSPPVVDPEPVPQPYIRARCTKTLMSTQSEENVDLDEIFSAGIARAREAKTRNPEKASSETWSRKKRQDPDLFRNLTKEEWEARCGNSRDKEPAQSRTPSSRETSLGARSKSPKSQEPKSHRFNRNRSPPMQKNVVEPIRNDSCSDFGSSLSSDGEASAQPKVTKLLKVIKDREKIAKNLTLGETMRDEVTAEMERERETEAERKHRKREKCLRRRDRKERLERENRVEEEPPRVEIKLEDPVPIKQEELIIEADQETVLHTQKSIDGNSVDKNGETSLSAILFQENNDYGNLKSREMLVAREYAGRQEPQEVMQHHPPEKLDAKKPQVSVVVNKIPGKPETREIRAKESRPKEAKVVLEKITSKTAAEKIVPGIPETISAEPTVQKTKEAKVVLEKITSRSTAKKIASKTETQETNRDKSPVEKPKETKDTAGTIKNVNKLETREKSTPTESTVKKLKENKIVAEKITSRTAAKKIVNKPETPERIRTESPVPKLKEPTTDKRTSRSATKKMRGGTSTPEIQNSATETLRVESPVQKSKETLVERPAQNHHPEKVETKEAKVAGTDVEASTSGTKKIDITVYKARKLQRNFGQREKRREGMKTRTESTTSAENETEKPKTAEDSTPLKNREDTDSALKKSETLKVSKPGDQEDDKKSDKDKAKGASEEKRKTRESERSRSREDSSEKSKRASQESSHGAKRQAKSVAKDTRPHQNNNVIESKDRKAKEGKYDKDVDSPRSTEEKIERRQTRDSKKKSEDKLKDKESRGDSPVTRSTKDKRATGRDKQRESKSKSIDDVEKEKETEKKNEDSKPKESEIVKTDEIIKEKQPENVEEVPKLKEAEDTEETLKQTEVKNVEQKEVCETEEILKQNDEEQPEDASKPKEVCETAEIVKQNEAEQPEDVSKQKEAKKAEEIGENVEEITKKKEREAEVTEEVPEAKQIPEIPEEKEPEEVGNVQRQEEAKETEERVEIPKRSEEEADEESKNQESKDSEKTEKSNFEDEKTDETDKVSVSQSIDEAESTISTETEKVLTSQVENATESTIPEVQPDLEKLEKDSGDDKETAKPQISVDESEINGEETLENSVSTVFECSNNEVKILLNDLIEKAISQLGLLNAHKSQTDGDTGEAAKHLEENGKALVVDSEEPVTEEATGGSSLRDFGDSSSPRTPGSPLIGFSEDSINCSILGKRKLAQSVLEITEDFVHNKRSKNFDDIMLDMIAESASISGDIREQILQDRDVEGEAKIDDAIGNLIPTDLGTGCLTPSGDTLSLGSSIDFDQGEFIVLSEISSDENFSQDGTLRPVVEEEKPEEKEEEKLESGFYETTKIDVENSEIELNVCQEEKTPSEHSEECPDVPTESAETVPRAETPLVPDEKVEEIKTPEVDTSEPPRPEPAKKISTKAVSPSRERSSSRSLHRVKHRHKTKYKKDKKIKMSDKKLKEVARDDVIVTLVKKQQTREVVMARMIEIDTEIHKLMSEKMKLYHMLESGELPTEQNPTIVKEKSNEITPAKQKSSTSSKPGGSESRKENGEKESTAKKSKKTQRHTEQRKTTSEKHSDGRTSVSKKKQTDEKSNAKSISTRKNSSVKEAGFLEDVDLLEACMRSKKVDPKKKESARKTLKKDEGEVPPEPANNVLQAQQIYSDESSQLSVSSLQESGKAGNKKGGLKGLALLEESYKREKAMSKKRRSNVSRASKKEETVKPITKSGALLSSEEDMPLNLLYVKKLRKKPAAKSAEVKRTKSTEVLDHVLEAINAVAENKVDEYQRGVKEKPEVQERRVKIAKSKQDPEETQSAWDSGDEIEPTENFGCEIEAENPESLKYPEEAKLFVDRIEESEDTNRSDLTECPVRINYDDIPDIDEAFVKIEMEKPQELPHPVVEIHNCETDTVSVASSSGLKRGKRKRMISGDEGKVKMAKSELKSCSVRLIDCKYTLLRSFKDVTSPPPLLGGEMRALSRSGFFDSEPDVRHSEEYDENDLEIMRIHAMSLPPEPDEVVQNFCFIEPESLRTLDETEVDQELMDVGLDPGGRDERDVIPTEEVPVFEEVAEEDEHVSDIIELETGEGELLTAEDDVLVVAHSQISEDEADEVQEVELPKVQYSVHKGPILDVKVFGDSILAASEDGVIYRYSQTCNGILNTYEGHKSAVTCIYVLPPVLSSGITRDLLFSGSLDGSLRCYDITTSVQVRGAADVGSSIQCMDQSWGMIYLGTKSGYVFRFHIKSHTFKGDEIKFSEESVLALKATTEGPRRVLIVASRSQPITIRDAKDGLFLRTLSGHKTHTVYSLMMDNNLVYCGTSSTAIPVFDFISGSQTRMYNAGPGVVCMRMYKWLLFAGCYDGNIYVFDTKEERLVCSIPGPGNMLLSMDIVKNKIVAGSKDRRLHMWRMPEQVLSLLSKRNNVREEK